MHYRIRSSGDIKTQGEIRKMHTNVSLPRSWDENVFNVLGIDPVLPTTQPEPSDAYQVVVYNGVTQDANGNWVQAWSVVDMFQDYTDDEGVTHTKAEQEAAYQADLDAKAAASVRSTRDAKIAETDWMALTDVTMSTEMAAYRQALRDITTHVNFPNLQDSDWPTKPEV